MSMVGLQTSLSGPMDEKILSHVIANMSLLGCAVLKLCSPQATHNVFVNSCVVGHSPLCHADCKKKQ